MSDRLRVGTRRSRLARTQTDWVVSRLARAAPELRFEPVPTDTSGDIDLSPGGSPDFTDAIDRALLRGELDLAVHSAKDLPVALDPRLELAACPPRAEPRDCLVVAPSRRGRVLPPGARVGSSSLRRRAQLLRWRPDLQVVEIRGNVDTRLELVRSGRIDAAILAVAGIARLGRSAEIDRVLPASRFLPAPAQGALAVVARASDKQAIGVARLVDDAPTRACITAERSFAGALGGDCRLPLGVLATTRARTLSLSGEVLSPDGRRSLRQRRRGPSSRAAAVGTALGQEFLDWGARDLMAPS